MSGAYKVVEDTPVDDQGIEAALNAWVAQGYRMERIEFVRQEGLKRPTMAYLFLWRDAPPSPPADAPAPVEPSAKPPKKPRAKAASSPAE
jgi:hypothetical protein